MPKVPETIDEVKTIECEERQVELDAIALYGNSQEFPAVAGSFAAGGLGGDEKDPAAQAADT